MAGGFRLEHFDLKQPAIGKGGFGEVYAADVIITPRFNLPDKVALKKVKKGVPTVKIKDEIRIMNEVSNHNNIVKFYGHFIEKGDNYIIMELCAHGDLRKYIREKGPLTEEGAADVVKQLICALRHCHKRKIMHRDLSAGNILIHRLPSGERAAPAVKVTDFGLARNVEKNEQAMTVAGTPGYMSEEVMNGDGYNEMTDVYSLGGLLYFMLSGEEPNYKEGLKKLHVLSDEAGDLVTRMRATQDRRPDFRQIFEHPFMKNSGAGGSVSREISRNSYRNSRSREASRDRQAAAPVYPRREMSLGRDRSESRNRGDGRVETGSLRRRSTEPRSNSQQRDTARPGSRADSGFQSAGQRDGGERRAQYRPDSVANGFSKARVPWPVHTDHLKDKRARTDVSRTIVDVEGNVTSEFVNKSSCVANVVRLVHTGGEQLVYFHRPRQTNAKLPPRDYPPVEVDDSVRAVPVRRLRDLTDPQRTLYDSVCYTLFQLGYDVNRVTITGHPLFPWAHSRLMVNGEMRIVPRDSYTGHREIYVRKAEAKNGVREITFKRQPMGQEGRSAPITDCEIRRKMGLLYDALVQQEHFVLECQGSFPVTFSFSSGGQVPPQSDIHPRGRVPSVTAASIASAPGRLPYHQGQLRPARAPSAPPATRRTDSDVRQVSRTTNPSIGSASSGQLTHHPHPPDQRRPLHEMQPTTAPHIGRKEFEVKQLGGHTHLFSVCHLPSGRYLRMSTAVPDQVIFRVHQNAPEKRFIYTDQYQVPREAGDLVDELRRRVAKSSASAPPAARRTDSDVRQVSRTTNPSIGSASSGQLTHHPHPPDQRRPLHEMQPTTAPHIGRKEFEVKQIVEDKALFSVRHLPSGRYLRMSTVVPQQIIFKVHPSAPEHRFIYTDEYQVPREAVSLVKEIKRAVASFR